MKDIGELRKEIDSINKEVVELLAKRMRVSEEIAEYKRQHNLPVYVPEREKVVIETAKELAKKSGLDEKMVEDVFWKIIEHTRNSEKRQI